MRSDNFLVFPWSKYNKKFVMQRGSVFSFVSENCSRNIDNRRWKMFVFCLSKQALSKEQTELFSS